MAISGIVLAGGRSSRMGLAKATLRLGGTTLIERVLAVLSELSEELIVVGENDTRFTGLNVKAVRDIFPDRGVLGGVYTGLQAAGQYRSVVVGCDMPFLNLELLHYMTEQAEGYDVVIPRVGSYLEALHAVYSRDCLAPIQRKLREGNLRLVSFFSEVRVRYIEAEEIARFDPEHLSFFNINEPADLERAESLLRPGGLGTQSAPLRGEGIGFLV